MKTIYFKENFLGLDLFLISCLTLLLPVLLFNQHVTNFKTYEDTIVACVMLGAVICGVTILSFICTLHPLDFIVSVSLIALSVYLDKLYVEKEIVLEFMNTLLYIDIYLLIIYSIRAYLIRKELLISRTELNKYFKKYGMKRVHLNFYLEETLLGEVIEKNLDDYTKDSLNSVDFNEVTAKEMVIVNHGLNEISGMDISNKDKKRLRIKLLKSYPDIHDNMMYELINVKKQIDNKEEFESQRIEKSYKDLEKNFMDKINNMENVIGDRSE